MNEKDKGFCEEEIDRDREREKREKQERGRGKIQEEKNDKKQE